MVNLTIKRQVAVSTSDYPAKVNTGLVSTVSGSVYVPFVFDEFTAPDISVTGCTLTNAATKITGTAGKFDDIRVGDVVVSSSTGTIAAKATFTRDCEVFTGLGFVIYLNTFNSGTLNVKVGDAVTGTGIPANTVVDRVDYTTRTIFLSKNATASGTGVTLTFAPPVRVTAVRPSTATANPNEVDIDSTISSAGANSTVVFGVGASEAVFSVVKLTPVASTTNGNVTLDVKVARETGSNVIGSTVGLNGLDVAALAYTSVGGITVDADTFLKTARLANV